MINNLVTSRSIHYLLVGIFPEKCTFKVKAIYCKQSTEYCNDRDLDLCLQRLI